MLDQAFQILSCCHHHAFDVDLESTPQAKPSLPFSQQPQRAERTAEGCPPVSAVKRNQAVWTGEMPTLFSRRLASS